MELEKLKQILPDSQRWIEVKSLTRGASKDVKLRLTDEDGSQYMIRIADGLEFESKKAIYDKISLAAATGVPINKPSGFGRTLDNRVYSIFTWVDGIEADTYYRYLNFKTLYDFGLEIGEISRKITSVKAPQSALFDWYEHQSKHYKTIREWYKNSGLKLENESNIFNCIENDFELMRNRPLTLIHGDYQISNFLIMPDCHAGVIDFDFMKYADPLIETSQCVYYTRPRSAAMAAGQADAYCSEENVVSHEQYFRYMRFYSAMAMMSGLQWWHSNGGENGAAFYLTLAKTNYEDFDGFKALVPAWYPEVKSKLGL